MRGAPPSKGNKVQSGNGAHKQAEALILSCLVPARRHAKVSLAALADVSIDWVATMRRANADFVGPALWSAFTTLGLEDRLPEDLRDYLNLLHRENARCNRHILAQCDAIGAALAAVGTEAVLLKGAAFLFEDGPGRDDRMLRDVDLLIDANCLDTVRVALRGIGYRDAGNIVWEPGHIHEPPMVHPEGLVSIEVHRDITIRANMLTATEVMASARRVAEGLRVPAPRHRIAHSAIHSEVINGGYHGHAVSLRDCLDLARLIGRGVSVSDWEHLVSVAPSRGYYRQLSAALHKAARFAGADLGAPFANDARGRRHADWCAFQRGWPMLDAGVRTLGVLHRALAWERDAYALGLGDDRGLSAQLKVNRRRLQRIRRALRGALAEGNEAV
jgi:hypothetical protein